MGADRNRTAQLETLRNTPPHSDWATRVPVDTRRLTLVGLSSTALLLGSFSVWASVAPIESAVFASGVLVATGNNHRVQHLQGGTVESIVVREGERVEKGDELVVLDRTAASADRDRLARELAYLLASSDRLVAERDGTESVQFSDETTAFLASEDALDLMDGEVADFTASAALLRNEIAVLELRAASLESQQRGAQYRRETFELGQLVAQTDVDRLQRLQGLGMVGLPALNQSLQQEAELSGGIREAETQYAMLQSTIAETREQIAALTTRRVQAAASLLPERRVRAASLREQLREADDVLERTVVRAPVAGTVLRLYVNSTGSVLMPGQPVVDILPAGGDLVVEARVSPADVAKLHVGQTARLRFTKANTAVTQEVPARLDYISADRLEDPATGRPYYVIRQTMTEAFPGGAEPPMGAGAPVEVLLTTGSRTFFDYVMRPLTDSLRRAFREA